MPDRLHAEDLAIVRRLARDHWVRLHGTPRVTVLAGGERARRFWTEWAALSELDTTLLDASTDCDKVVREAVARASASHAELASASGSPSRLRRSSRARRARSSAGSRRISVRTSAVATAASSQTIYFDDGHPSLPSGTTSQLWTEISGGLRIIAGHI